MYISSYLHMSRRTHDLATVATLTDTCTCTSIILMVPILSHKCNDRLFMSYTFVQSPGNGTCVHKQRNGNKRAGEWTVKIAYHIMLMGEYV